MFGTHMGTEIVASTLSNAGERVYSSVTRDEKAHKLIIKIVNGTSDAKPLSINIDGAQGEATRQADYPQRQDAERHQQHHGAESDGSG